MKNTIKTLVLMIATAFIISCDNNDDAQTTPQTPTDGFAVGSMFYQTPNAYIAIDQTDANNDGYPDYYSLFFTNGRMTDTYGDAGVGYAYAYSENTTKLVQLKLLVASNSSFTTGAITAGNTYTASSIITPVSTGFSQDSFMAYNLQVPTPYFGTLNSLGYNQIQETVGVWHYPGTVGPQVTINAINIDSATPANSTIDVDYTFLDTNGVTITGHYTGTLGIILD